MPKLNEIARVTKASRKGLSLLCNAGWWMRSDGSVAKRYRRRGTTKRTK